MYCLSEKRRKSLNTSEQLDKVKDLTHTLSYVCHHYCIHQPSHSHFPKRCVGFYHLVRPFILQSSGVGCPHPWTFCPLWNTCLRTHEEKLRATLRHIVSSLRLKLTITRRHACLKSNYSYYRGNTTAIPWLERIAWVAPVATLLTSIETKYKKIQMCFVSLGWFSLRWVTSDGKAWRNTEMDLPQRSFRGWEWRAPW